MTATLAVGRPPEAPDDDAFRMALRSFLATHHPGPLPPRRLRLDFARRWAAFLADTGWAAPSWPRRWGGMDLPLSQQLIYHQEMAAAGVPNHPSPHAFMVGPTLLAAGTEEQCRRFLRPTLRADILWAQGFSEPDAGSDLAALRTRAVRDGNEYVVNGVKIWSSRAEYSDWLFALVRTGPIEAAQAGISYLLVDLSSPGLAVLPIRDMTGGHRFTQITFTDVRVPVANRVGEEGGGWAIARTTLGHERSTSRLPAVLRYRRVVAELVALAGQRGVAADPRLRQRLARAHIGCELLIATSQRIVGALLQGDEPGPASSVFRLAHARFEQELHETAMSVLGAAGMLASDAPSFADGRWVWGFLNTRASTIGAGTAEIQRNTIAERVLGLPRDLEGR